MGCMKGMLLSPAARERWRLYFGRASEGGLSRSMRLQQLALNLYYACTAAMLLAAVGMTRDLAKIRS